ncbi:DSBA-like thioredoxin domain containing protein [Novymonas esmeraldas]|uniref:DSBA-like thioredoxin domain containing protein n=1 Tax=Novymonas esmeraldas TaxID=1808958 RepID=A0AAW0EL72_9TRYP
MSSTKIVVNVTSDVACPWCWVGKRAIEVAAASPSYGKPIEVELHWHPFQLSPEIPTGTATGLTTYLAKKFGNPNLPEQWAAQPERIPMNQSCRSSNLPNIEFRYPPSAVRFNTYRAHTLLTYAGAVKQDWAAQNRLKEALLRRTHKESKNLDDLDELTAAAKEAGVANTREEVEAILQDGAVKSRLDEELRQSRQLPHFDGVPYFSLPGGQQFSGGQPVDVFVAALKKAAQAV